MGILNWLSSRNAPPSVEHKSASYYASPFRIGGELVVQESMATWYDCHRVNGDVASAVDKVGKTALKDGFTVSVKDKPFSNPGADAFVRAFLAAVPEIVTHGMVGGNAFITLLRNRGGAGTPVGLVVRSPLNVDIRNGAAGTPVSYTFRDSDGTLTTYDPRDVRHWKWAVNPLKPALGVSPLRPVVWDALSDDRAARYLFNFFENNALPASLFHVKSNPSPNALQDVKNWLTEKFGGARNAGKAMVTDVIEKVETLASPIKDMQFPDARRISTEKVCAALGVPKSVLNYTDGVNYSTGGTQYTQFIENTVRPVERRLAEMCRSVLEEYDPRVAVVPVDQHIDDLAERLKVGTDAKNGGILSVNEARDLAGYPHVEEPGADAVGNLPAQPTQAQ